MRRRTLQMGAQLFLLLSSGCERTIIAHDQDERVANSILAILVEEAGIDAHKVSCADLEELRFEIHVPADQAVVAMKVLRKHNLPKPGRDHRGQSAAVQGAGLSVDWSSAADWALLVLAFGFGVCVLFVALRTGGREQLFSDEVAIVRSPFGLRAGPGAVSVSRAEIDGGLSATLGGALSAQPSGGTPVAARVVGDEAESV